MPLYEYECKCGAGKAEMRTVPERNEVPNCDRCLAPMALIVSPVAGIVKNPAAGPRKPK